MATDKTQTQDRELVGDRQQTISGDYTFFFSLTQSRIRDGQTDQPQRHKTENRHQTNGNKTVFIAQLTNGPPIHISRFTR